MASRGFLTSLTVEGIIVRGPILMCWEWNSDCFAQVRDEVARISTRFWQPTDPLESLSEVWIGLHGGFAEGQILTGQEIGRMWIIIFRRVTNYYQSQGVRRPRQPTSSLSEQPDIGNVRSTLDPPDQVAANRELFGMMEKALSEMPAHWAEALRSRFGYQDAPRWADLSKISGTTRQNVAKRAKKGLEELKLRFA
jgi:hypothetical protein